jgi:transcriptional antiterminator NusG
MLFAILQCYGVHRYRTTPTPVSEEESKDCKKEWELKSQSLKLIFQLTLRKIIDGPFKNLEGKITNIDEEKGRVKVLVSMFGRETPIELDFLQIKKI